MHIRYMYTHTYVHYSTLRKHYIRFARRYVHTVTYIHIHIYIYNIGMYIHTRTHTQIYIYTYTPVY